MGNSQFRPWRRRTSATGVFCKGYVEKEGLNLAPQVGLEPTTLRLTAECSTIELLRSVAIYKTLHQTPALQVKFATIRHLPDAETASGRPPALAAYPRAVFRSIPVRPRSC